jgi:hypothetical protein
MSQIEVVTVDHAMHNVCGGELSEQLGRYGGLAYT